MARDDKEKGILPKVGALVVAGSAAALALQFYRRPFELANSVSRAGLLLAGAREGVCDVAGLPIHYYTAGRRGIPLILVHGLGGSAEDWARVIPGLSKEYLVYALDLPGFGRSAIPPEPLRIRTFVKYLAGFIEALGYPEVAMAGNSLGGWIATTFALKYPERVRQLYLLNSAGLWREDVHSPFAKDREEAALAIERLIGKSIWVPGFLLDAFVRNAQRPVYAGFLALNDRSEELDSVLSSVAVPTTIIWGARDGIFPLICAEAFHEKIRDSELILLDDVAHVPQIQAARRVVDIITSKAPAQLQHRVNER